MTSTSENIFNSALFEKECLELYGISNGKKERFLKLLSDHKNHSDGKVVFFSSPGRIELCGNHTDHQRGRVIAAAVSVDTLAAVTKRDDNIIEVFSEGYPPVKFDVNSFGFESSEIGSSAALIKGVVAYYKHEKYPVGGFTATLTSSVMKGSGVSSSASFEVLIAEILNDLYSDNKINAVTMAIAARYAENVYFNKPSGLMDQAAIAIGGIAYIDFFNAVPEVKKLSWDMDEDIYLVNAGGDHSDLTHEYAAIRDEMEKVAAYFKKSCLIEVDEKEFYDSIPVLQHAVSGRAILRAIHFFDEIKRVDAFSAELIKNSCEPTFKYINGSGNSSEALLQNLHAEGDGSERIPLAVTLAKKIDGVKAVRVHGGGFAGTTLNFVEKKSGDKFISEMGKVFGKENIVKLKIRNSGARRLIF